MFVTKDRLERDSDRARRSLASVESFAALATFGQAPTYAAEHRVAPRREVVVPRPEGRGIRFSGALDPIAPLVFNNLRVRFVVQKPQQPYYHSVAHSSIRAENITAIFPTTSALLRHSPAPERKSTTLFSIACTLFCKNTGVGGLCQISEFAKPFKSVAWPHPWSHRIANVAHNR